LPVWLFFIFGRWIFADCGAPSALRNRRLALSFIHLRRATIFDPPGLGAGRVLAAGSQGFGRGNCRTNYPADARWQDAVDANDETVQIASASLPSFFRRLTKGFSIACQKSGSY
jgi:hypothetical protein